MGIRPGSRIEVVRRGTLGGILHLRAGLVELMLRHGDAMEMLTTPDQPRPISPA
jgi:Fe2+ transport system protein FeoA